MLDFLSLKGYNSFTQGAYEIISGSSNSDVVTYVTGGIKAV